MSRGKCGETLFGRVLDDCSCFSALALLMPASVVFTFGLWQRLQLLFTDGILLRALFRVRLLTGIHPKVL